MTLGPLDYLFAAAAAGGAGAVNALAGGGTLISFPTLVALGVPAVGANVTNTVSLLPGYGAGTWAQRDDLRHQVGGARALTLLSGAGGLAGSVLLIAIPSHAFRVAVPYLILLSCLLLLVQERLRAALRPAGRVAPGGPVAEMALGEGSAGETSHAETASGSSVEVPGGRSSAGWSPMAGAAVFAAAVYGGFFGAGLGILLLAVLGVFSAQPLVEINALKQLLSAAINLVAAVFFAFSGHVQWELVPVMAVASIVGGTLGGRAARVVPAPALRRAVVLAGVAIAIVFWIT